ncbi:putative isomerase YbhE [Exidia glandulosa HHB12029]|uniref:Putative isomerase YbhE n=1 Tax=Exidia glandulosa HHB12029 TaxID=1314781 RepID=A0A166A2G7_EXIGL|nr:putative isomerase YbhE [Exidia glandulosa HHB12029]
MSRFVHRSLTIALLASSSALAASPAWGQCGGTGWNGDTTCVSGYVCTAISPPYYSQCIPGAAPAPTTTATTTTAQPAPTGSPSTLRTILAGGYGSTITTFQFSPSNGSISVSGSCASGSSPSWMELSPTNKNILYSTNEISTGGMSSFTISSSGICSRVGTASSNGDGPAYMAVFTSGSEVMAMNYNSGDGISYTLSSDKLQFTNPIPIAKFPVAVPHPHMVAQYGSEVFVTDLGADKVWRLARSGNAWSITGFIPQPSGSGPRHMQIRGSTIFILHELDNTLSSQPIPSSPGANSTTTISSLSVLPPGITNNYPGRFHAGELIMSPDGAFLYASNRDTATPPDSRGDAIAIFSVDSAGHLTLVKQVFTGLQVVRGMTMSPDGTFIIAGGQQAGGVVVFQRVNGGSDLQVVASNAGAPATTTFVWI